MRFVSLMVSSSKAAKQAKIKKERRLTAHVNKATEEINKRLAVYEQQEEAYNNSFARNDQLLEKVQALTEELKQQKTGSKNKLAEQRRQHQVDLSRAEKLLEVEAKEKARLQKVIDTLKDATY